MDGLPIYRSANKNFWPVLFNIYEYPTIKPMAIGIFYGESKPQNVKDYLTPFVDEMGIILEHGIMLNGYKISVRIRCFICDSPARAFVKGIVDKRIFNRTFLTILVWHLTGTVNFNAKEGCQKCCIVGKYSHISNTVVFTKIHTPARTDELFRSKEYVNHIKVDTPLAKLPIDLIKDFVVADPLHLLELGVMKRLIVGWRTGNLGYATKWSMNEQAEISELLVKIQMPSEIHRDARSLKLFSNWKGLEFRNFLNYYGVAILLNYLPKKHYEHFLKLFCAVTICSAQKYLCHLNVAKILFTQFIKDYKALYGSEYITSNVHNLEHVVDDVRRFGILSSISAYPFESSLYSIKRMIRAGKNPLVQIANRLTERLFIEDFNYRDTDGCQQKPIIRIGKNTCAIELTDFKLNTSKFKDMWFRANNTIFCFDSAFEQDSSFYVLAYAVHTVADLFVSPLKSSLLNIFKADISNIKDAAPPTRIAVAEISCKYAAIQLNQNKYAFIPLLHTLTLDK